jgi:hypothetical protein
VNIALAMAWRPNARDVQRFKWLLPIINDLYCGVSIVMPPHCALYADELKSLSNVKVSVSKTQNENRRYLTLQQALDFEQATHVHYCDGDHVLSRMEQYLDDWKRSLDAIAHADCVVIERSAAVFESYPPALRETEQIINLVGSYLLGQPIDLGSGARGFSRDAVKFLMEHAFFETHSVATDSEWIVLLHCAGFHVGIFISEGAIYEVESPQQMDSVEQWSKRIEIARMIIQTGLDAANRRDISH